MTTQPDVTALFASATIFGAAFLPDTDETRGVAWSILPSGNCYAGGFSLRDGMIVMHFGASMKATQVGNADIIWLAENLFCEMLRDKNVIAQTKQMGNERGEAA